MADTTHEIDELTAFFDAAKREAPRPAMTVLAQVAADAEQVQSSWESADADIDPEQAGVTATQHRGSAWFADSGIWQQFRAGLGGWAGLGGLATACAAGVWIGFSPPSQWPDPVGIMIQSGVEVDYFESEETAFLLSVEEG